jgi:glycosyltransferase involved in cell wall biosynthesis
VSAPVVVHLAKVSGISGAEAHLLSLLPDLRAEGWDVRFLMLHEDEPGAWRFADSLRAVGIPLDAIQVRRDVDPIAFLELVAYLRRARPSIVHTHLVHADAYGQIAGLVARVPARLSTKHGFNEFREERLFALGDRLVGSAATTQIAISRGLARYLAEKEGFREEGFQIVHYGIDSLGEPSPYPANSVRFLSIGRLIPIKGHLVLLRALRRALESRPELELRIAGRGVLDGGLKAYARELGIADSVHFLGQVTPVQDEIEQAAAVLVPSLGEGFGMVALEAMERARPVVATDIGGLSDIVRHGETGLLVPSADADALAEAMLAIVGDRDAAAAMGVAGRARALDHFAAARCTSRTSLVYRAALDGTAST